MSTYKTVSNIGFVVIILGIIVAIYGFKFMLIQNDLEANGVRVKGTVIDINENAIYRSPYVKFNTLQGEEIIFLSELEVNHQMFDYIIGQEVDVIYHKDNPRQCKIDAFWENHFLEIFLGSFGVLVMFIGLIIRWAYMRKHRKFIERGY